MNSEHSSLEIDKNKEDSKFRSDHQTGDTEAHNRSRDSEALSLTQGEAPPFSQVSSSPKVAPNLKIKRAGNFNFLKWLFHLFSGRKATEERMIYLEGGSMPYNYFGNKIRNQKTNVLTIMPVFLYNQFKFFFNLFFLMITLSQLYEPLRVGLIITYWGPLLLVLALSFSKEVYDEVKRFIKDRQYNSEKFQKLTRKGLVSICSSKIRVGDVIMCEKNKRVPADLLLLWTSDEDGIVYLKTDQLDGETDWKLREAVSLSKKYMNSFGVGSILGSGHSVQADKPIQGIYEFKGVYNGINEESVPLRLKNTLWAHTTLEAGEAYGLVLYSGKETRMEMNSKNPIAKFGKTDLEINTVAKFLFIFVVIAAIIATFLRGISLQFETIVTLFRYILLLASIIPISLRVNVDFAKIYYSLSINKDPELNGCQARNSTIPEELGRIEYLLSDKTGTLTQNHMIFKKLCTLISTFTEENLPLMSEFIDRDLKERQTVGMQSQSGRKKSKYALMREMVSALMLCHNVTPSEDNGERILQAASPDEIALVKFGESMGFRLVKRDVNEITITNPAGVTEVFQVIENFPFSSDRKRMGILLKEKSTGNMIFYLKGADCIIQQKVDKLASSVVEEECDNLAKEGLRTLVITQKYISKEFYEEWRAMMLEASKDLRNREKREEEVIEILEQDMELLGITGVEDLLQDEIKSVIETLRNAGIKIWMLTGDKLETAKCIAISTGLKSSSERFCVLKFNSTESDFIVELDKFDANPNEVLVIEGGVLAKIFEKRNLMERFIRVASKAPSVVCCRCAPTQKADITLSLKNILKKEVCGIGDGGNDVGMIMSANVGVGIEGKEGMQAALSSDFSIKEFKTIKKLFLWHGRLSYIRTALLANFVIHRGLIISVVQFLFSIIYQNNTIQIYNGYLMLGYATVFTSVPIFSLIFVRDVTLRQVMDYPILYKFLQNGRRLNRKTFLIWCFVSIYQGAAIILFTIILFDKSFIEIVTITFTALIMIELFNIISNITHFDMRIIGGVVATFLMYVFFFIFFGSWLQISPIDLEFIEKVCVIVVFAWGPVKLSFFIKKRWFPSLNDKVTKQAIKYDNQNANKDEALLGDEKKSFNNDFY